MMLQTWRSFTGTDTRHRDAKFLELLAEAADFYA